MVFKKIFFFAEVLKRINGDYCIEQLADHPQSSGKMLDLSGEIVNYSKLLLPVFLLTGYLSQDTPVQIGYC